MSTVKLALYKGKGQIGNALIRAWTRSDYSHCELVVESSCSTFWLSSTIQDGGVRAKDIDPHPGAWDFVPLPWADARKVAAYFDRTRGQLYGWLDLARSQVFNTASDQPGAAFCSEWCAAALGIPNPSAYSPKTLGDLCAWLGSK